MPPWALRQPAEENAPLFPAYQPTENRTLRAPSTPLMAYLAERELLLPARLLGSAHQPLAFVLAHGCYLFAPIADLLGLTPGQGWTAWIERVTALALGLEHDRVTAGADDDCA